MKQIFTLECSWCKHLKTVKAGSNSEARSLAGKCEHCAQKGINSSNWHIR